MLQLELGLGLGLGPGNVFFPCFSLLKVTNTFVMCISGNCDVHGIRTTTVRDVMMMYSQEQYMENVPQKSIMQYNHLAIHR